VDDRKNNWDDEDREPGVRQDDNDGGDESFDINIQPDVSALRMFRSMSFTPWYALGEFVDNSITSAMKNKEALVAANGEDYKVRIQIDFLDGSNDLVIKDNAAGISREEMQRALRMGKAPQDISVGLSRHGVGMKAAAFWWGSRLEIRTYPLGEEHGWYTVVDVSDGESVAASARVTPIPGRGYPGTEVTVRNLWQKTPVKRTKGAIRAYLPSIYRAFLGGGTGSADIECVLEYDGAVLRYENPPLLNAPFWDNREGPADGAEAAPWMSKFDLTLTTKKRITGWYGILETLSRDKSGFFLHYRGKGIAGVVPVLSGDDDRSVESQGAKDAIARASYKPRRIFGPAGQYRDLSFVGEFDVSDFGKTISTDAPLWSPDEEQEFVEALYKHMTSDPNRNFIRMADHYRRRAAARETQREIEVAREAEAKRMEDALSHSVEHVEITDVEPATYEAPPVPAPDVAQEVEREAATHLSIQDRDGHTHAFEIEFISDRSADFIGLYETGNELKHTVQINRLHPALDDIPEDAKTHVLIERIAVALASAEVFLTMLGKQRVRELMNSHLSQIGTRVAND
jgi:hypothetical protein